MPKAAIKQGQIISYQNLLSIKSGENGENLVSLNQVVPEILSRYHKKDMLPFTGQEIFVREGLAKRLGKVSKQLKKKNPDYFLKVVYGYRHPLIQKKYFLGIKNKLAKQFPSASDKKLTALAHNFVAVPEVAGHIAGGAVDITIATKQGELDMGTKIADFSIPGKMKTFAKGISSAQLTNRRLLHNLMLANGFAPFYGEWWHFSYGDKEWAYFYGLKRSLYSELEFTV